LFVLSIGFNHHELSVTDRTAPPTAVRTALVATDGGDYLSS